MPADRPAKAWAVVDVAAVAPGPACKPQRNLKAASATAVAVLQRGLCHHLSWVCLGAALRVSYDSAGLLNQFCPGAAVSGLLCIQRAGPLCTCAQGTSDAHSVCCTRLRTLCSRNWIQNRQFVNDPAHPPAGAR